VRIAWVVITLVTSVLPMVIIYILLAAVLPTAEASGRSGSHEREWAEGFDADPEASAPEVARRPDWPIVFGILLLTVGAMLLVAQFIPLRWDIIWPVSIIAVGVGVILLSLRGRTGDRR
jgi:hypothetical protein